MRWQSFCGEAVQLFWRFTENSSTVAANFHARVADILKSENWQANGRMILSGPVLTRSCRFTLGCHNWHEMAISRLNIASRQAEAV